MASIVSFTFNPFQENTYILYDNSKDCIIIDPGCYAPNEKDELSKYIDQMGLNPVKLVLTHAHIDHILGNKYVTDTYGIDIVAHKESAAMIEAVPEYGKMFGIMAEPSPAPASTLKDGDVFEFGETKLDVLYTPGHSLDSISFYCKEDGFVVGGDVLFYESIGRTDLPGGDYDTLINSIRTKLFTLDDSIEVYCGHGPKTTIGYEKQHNPFMNE